MQGLFVPQFTAFKKNNDVDYAATKAHGEYLVSQGVSGLVPFGTFGEGASLSLAERIRITEDLASVVQTKALIPCIISNSLGDIWEYLAFVEDLPIQAVMVIPPSYFRPIDNDSLINFYKAVAEKTKHKIVAYNIPSFSLKIDAEVAAQIPIWGVKDSSGSYESGIDFIKHGVKVLLGSDNLLVKGIVAGAQGGICGLANFFPAQMAKVYQLASSAIEENILEAHNIINKIYEAVNCVSKPDFNGVQSIGALKNASHNFIPVNVGDMRSPVPTYRSPAADISAMVERAKFVYSLT